MRDQLESSGKVTHGWLGVLCADDADRTGGGATVTARPRRRPGGQRRQASRSATSITRAGGQLVGGCDDLVAEWRRRRPGDSITIELPPGPRRDREPSTTVDAHGPAGDRAARRSHPSPDRPRRRR